VALRLAPVSTEEARAMIAETRVERLLRGFRGARACDLAALAEVIHAVSVFAHANAERVKGIDLNPVVVSPEGAWALDALIELKEPQ
jgi:hypothetical protein